MVNSRIYTLQQSIEEITRDQGLAEAQIATMNDAISCLRDDRESTRKDAKLWLEQLASSLPEKECAEILKLIN